VPFAIGAVVAWIVAVALGHARGDAFWPGIALGIVNIAARRCCSTSASTRCRRASLAPLALMPIVGRSLTPVDWEVWHLPMLLFVGAVCSYTGFWSIMRVNQLGTTGQAGVVGYIIPVIGVAGGIVLFGDELTIGVVLGGLLILTAVGIIGRASRPRRLEADPLATARSS
jgi:drug/metabolite transporter (DMT)-like permease